MRHHRSLREVVELRSPVSFANICAMVVFLAGENPPVYLRKLAWFLVSELVIPGLWVLTSCCNDVGGRRGWHVRTGFRYYLFHGTRPVRDRFECQTTAIRYENRGGKKRERIQRNIPIKNSWRILIRFATQRVYTTFHDRCYQSLRGGSLEMNNCPFLEIFLSPLTTINIYYYFNR